MAWSSNSCPVRRHVEIEGGAADVEMDFSFTDWDLLLPVHLWGEQNAGVRVWVLQATRVDGGSLGLEAEGAALGDLMVTLDVAKSPEA